MTQSKIDRRRGDTEYQSSTGTGLCAPTHARRDLVGAYREALADRREERLSVLVRLLEVGTHVGDGLSAVVMDEAAARGRGRTNTALRFADVFDKTRRTSVGTFDHERLEVREVRS